MNLNKIEKSKRSLLIEPREIVVQSKQGIFLKTFDRRNDDEYRRWLRTSLLQQENVDACYDFFLREMLEVKRYSYPRIYLINGETSNLLRCLGLEDVYSKNYPSFAVDNPVLRETVKKGRPYFAEDIFSDPSVIINENDPLNYIRERSPLEKACIAVPFEGLALALKKKIRGVFAANFKPKGKEPNPHKVATLMDLVSIVGDIVVNQMMIEELQESNKRDGHTKLYNKKTFHEDLSGVLEKTKSSGESHYLVLIDLDEFKTYNDKYGHLVGDDIISKVGEILGDIKNSKSYRNGSGDEFAILLKTDSEGEVLSLVNNIRDELREFSSFKGWGAPLTISVGITPAKSEFERGRDWYKKADVALYEAKRNHNDVVLYR